MLLEGDARVWYMHQNYNAANTTYATLKSDLETHFRPADHAWRAREALANCKQRDPINVLAYTTAFKRCVARVPGTLSPEDVLDRYLRGLHPSVAKDVLLQLPNTLDEATALAERVAAVWRFTNTGKRPQRFQEQPRERSDSTRTPGGYAPMVLGQAQGQARGRGMRGGRNGGRGN